MTILGFFTAGVFLGYSVPSRETKHRQSEFILPAQETENIPGSAWKNKKPVALAVGLKTNAGCGTRQYVNSCLVSQSIHPDYDSLILDTLYHQDGDTIHCH